MKRLKEKFPTLGNRTPRQHAKSAKGRLEVARMIRTMPPTRGPDGLLIEPPREEMLRALGLEGE